MNINDSLIQQMSKLEKQWIKIIVQTCFFLFTEDVDDIAGKHKSQHLHTNPPPQGQSHVYEQV